MDDVLRRLGNVEKDVGDIRVKVSAIEATLPHLATKTDMAKLEAAINTVDGKIASSALRLIQWMIGTMIALTALAFAIARYVAPAGP